MQAEAKNSTKEEDGWVWVWVWFGLGLGLVVFGLLVKEVCEINKIKIKNEVVNVTSVTHSNPITMDSGAE